jgi:hypothetical protein
MRVGNVDVNRNLKLESRTNISKSDFSESLNLANKPKTKEELELQMKEIKETGEKLVVTKSYEDVLKYKKLIKNYLKSVVDYIYDINKNSSFWDRSYFTTVKSINEKLEDITRELIYEEQENINIASKIDEINGLLVDIYV